MNLVSLMGRLGRDPELRNSGDTTIARWSLAIDSGKDKPPTWIDCVAFDRVADVVSKYVKKGNRLIVNGRINVRDYEKDGERRRITEVIADRVFLIDRNPDQAASQQEQPAKPTSNRIEDMSDDIPF